MIDTAFAVLISKPSQKLHQKYAEEDEVISLYLSMWSAYYRFFQGISGSTKREIRRGRHQRMWEKIRRSDGESFDGNSGTFDRWIPAQNRSKGIYFIVNKMKRLRVWNERVRVREEWECFLV